MRLIATVNVPLALSAPRRIALQRHTALGYCVTSSLETGFQSVPVGTSYNCMIRSQLACRSHGLGFAAYDRRIASSWTTRRNSYASFHQPIHPKARCQACTMCAATARLDHIVHHVALVDLGLLREPDPRRRRLAIPQQRNRLAKFKITNDRPVALVAPPCPVVDPDHGPSRALIER